MTNLVRRDPFLLDLYDFRRDFDRVYYRFLVRSCCLASSIRLPIGGSILPAIS